MLRLVMPKEAWGRFSFAKEVDWNNGIFLQAPSKFQPLEAVKAIDKMIDRLQPSKGSSRSTSQDHQWAKLFK